MKNSLLLIIVLSVLGCKAFQVPVENPEEVRRKYMSTHIAMSDNNFLTGKVEYLKLSKANYKINHSIAGYTTEAKGENLAYLLAAELCYEDGYDFFIIPGIDTNTEGDFSGPSGTSLIKCLKNPDIEETTILFESQVLIKSISEKYDKLEHMSVRYPRVK